MPAERDTRDTYDGNGHDHGHGHGSVGRWWRRAAHALSELVGGHSHDSGEQVDAALEADADGQRTLWWSLAVLAVTAAIQAVVVTVSGSVALLGDALHNVADALTAVPLMVAFRLARRPANKRFTYGFGRAEDLGGVFVVLMIALSTALAAYAAIDRLLHPQPVHHLTAVAIAALVGFLGNEFVAQYRIRVGRRIGSAALVADGVHARTDGFTSLAVLAGATGVAAGWDRADAVIGLVIALAIVGVLRSAAAQVGARLLDAVDPGLVDQAHRAVTSVPQVDDVRELRIRWIGHTLRAEVDIAVATDLSLVEAHDIAHHVERHLLARVPRLGAAIIHVSPAGSHHLA